jgi:hypothetical protein
MRTQNKMARLLLSLLVLNCFAFSTISLADQNQKTGQANGKAKHVQKKKAHMSKEDSQLGTSFRFGADSLHGRYRNSTITTATVENDKYLDDLLGAPKNFDTRAQQDAQKN